MLSRWVLAMLWSSTAYARQGCRRPSQRKKVLCRICRSKQLVKAGATPQRIFFTVRYRLHIPRTISQIAPAGRLPNSLRILMRTTSPLSTWIRNGDSSVGLASRIHALGRCWVLLFALWICAACHRANCDVPVAESLLNPASPEEAWNVIGLVTRNVEKLLEESRLREIPPQLTLCAPALRRLAQAAGNSPAKDAISKGTSQSLDWVVAITQSATANDRASTESGARTLKMVLSELAKHYDAATVKADIFVCPMHPDCVSAKAKDGCKKCGMDLLIRRLPYSFIYTKPGEPTVMLSATASAPCEAGKKIDVKIQLVRKDKSPVQVSDLMEMHTEPIHLLIEDPSLSDYHHEHPVTTGTPGEYAFSFTPKRTAPYRIWADIVPVATGIQELPYADLPSSGSAGPPQDTANRFTSKVDGYQFELTLAGGNHLPIQAAKARAMNITITDASGQPVKTLEPVMNAFAHLVGFYDDYQTVVHLHPGGGDVLNSSLRGGPSLGFQFFPPKPGFIRLYCQVSIGGKMFFAPFNVNVVP